MYGLKTEAAFDSAHFLADYYGKCENLHGHRWRVVVYLKQEELQKEGTMKDMVLDFGVFKTQAPNATNTVLYIAIGVIALAVIAVAVLFIRKKKTPQGATKE